MPELLLVVGSSRSGTTMTSRILGRSPSVAAFDELHYVTELLPAEYLDRSVPAELQRAALAGLEWRRQHGLFAARPRASAPAPEPAHPEPGPLATTGAQLLRDFLARAAGEPGVSFVCEQTPENLYHVEAFLRALPGTRVVALVRDPRDVLLSQRNRWKRRRLGSTGHTRRELFRNWANYQPVLLALMWRRATRLAVQLAATHEQVHVLRFEDLIEEPEAAVKEVCAFLGIPFTPDLLSVPMVGSSLAVDAREGEGIRRDVVGRWAQSLSPAEVWICERVIGDDMIAQDYPLSGTRPNLSQLLRLAFGMLVRLPFLVPMNAERASGLARRAAGRALGRRPRREPGR